jgi:hypothetical protein
MLVLPAGTAAEDRLKRPPPNLPYYSFAFASYRIMCTEVGGNMMPINWTG